MVVYIETGDYSAGVCSVKGKKQWSGYGAPWSPIWECDFMDCCSFFKWEENQICGCPDNPYQYVSLFVNIAWSIVSKVADKSSSVRTITLPLSIMKMMSVWWFGGGGAQEGRTNINSQAVFYGGFNSLISKIPQQSKILNPPPFKHPWARALNCLKWYQLNILFCFSDHSITHVALVALQHLFIAFQCLLVVL